MVGRRAILIAGAAVAVGVFTVTTALVASPDDSDSAPAGALSTQERPSADDTIPAEAHRTPREQIAGGGRCVQIKADKGPTDLSVDLGCARGLDLISSKPVEHNGRLCMKVTYIPRAGAEATTRLFCPDRQTETP